MKKIILALSLVFLVPLLSGCLILNAWVLKGDGKNLGGGYGPATGEAKRADIIGLRYLCITDQRITTSFLENLPVIRITVDNDNKTKSIEIGPEVNFEPKNKE